MILFGGTFDPVHDGHLYWADRIRRAAGCAQLSLLPCAQPVHRQRPGASALQRKTMLQLACRQYDGLLVDDSELQREGGSYTVLTLREKQQQQPDEKLYWVLGQDSYNDLYNWREPEAILALACLIVMLRPGCELASHSDLRQRWAAHKILTPETALSAHSGDVLVVGGDAMAISATAIRTAIRQGRRQPPGLPAIVADYIHEQHLYQP